MMDLKMKNTIIIAVTIFLLCGSHTTLANVDSEIRTVWPEAVTFSKPQMTRLDVVDPSYENRLKNIRRTTNADSPFRSWESVINRNL